MSWKNLECRKRTALLARYSDHPAGLTEEQRSDLERHLDGCLECRRELDIISGVGAVLRANVPPAVEPSSDLWNRLEAQISADGASTAAPSRRPAAPRPVFSRWGVAVPAAALAAVAAFGAMVMHQQEAVVPEAANVRQASVTPRSPLPAAVLPPTGQNRIVPGMVDTGALDEPIRIAPSPRKRARVQREALTAARRAAAEARAVAGMRDVPRPTESPDRDPFHVGASASVARQGVPGAASAPVASLGKSRPAVPAEPRMLALAVKPVGVTSAGAPPSAPGGEVVTSTPPAAVEKPREPGGVLAGNDSPTSAPAVTVVASNSDPGRAAEPESPGTGRGSRTAGASAAAKGRDTAAEAALLSPSEAVNLHARQRSLFLNYGSGQQ